MRIVWRPGQLSLLAATKLLGVSYRTVRSMVIDGRLRGGKTPTGVWFADEESVLARAKRRGLDRYRY